MGDEVRRPSLSFGMLLHLLVTAHAQIVFNSFFFFFQAKFLTKCTPKRWRKNQTACQYGDSTPRHETSVVVSPVNLTCRRQGLGHSCEGLSR